MKKSNVIVYGVIVFVSLLLAGCISNEKPKQEEADKQIIARMSLEWAVRDLQLKGLSYENSYSMNLKKK